MELLGEKFLFIMLSYFKSNEDPEAFMVKLKGMMIWRSLGSSSSLKDCSYLYILVICGKLEIFTYLEIEYSCPQTYSESWRVLEMEAEPELACVVIWLNYSLLGLIIFKLFLGVLNLLCLMFLIIL
jgi:hypothetical protein